MFYSGVAGGPCEVLHILGQTIGCHGGKGSASNHIAGTPIQCPWRLAEPHPAWQETFRCRIWRAWRRCCILAQISSQLWCSKSCPGLLLSRHGLRQFYWMCDSRDCSKSLKTLSIGCMESEDVLGRSLTGARHNLRTATMPAAMAAAGIGGKTSRVASNGYLWWQPWNKKCAVIPQYPSTGRCVPNSALQNPFAAYEDCMLVDLCLRLVHWELNKISGRWVSIHSRANREFAFLWEVMSWGKLSLAIPGILWKAKRCIQYSINCQDTKPVTTRTAVMAAPEARLVSKQYMRKGIHSSGTTHLHYIQYQHEWRDFAISFE